MPEARYKSLVDQLAHEIRAGRLRPGTRLPTHRRLAERHGLALATATRVYAELEAMGLVNGEVGRGTFVRETALPRGHGIDQSPMAPGLVDLNFNYPSLPGQADLLRAGLRQLAAGGELEAMLRYAPHGGRPHERESVARHLVARGLSTEPACVLLVDGAQHGLAVTAMALLQPGDVVAVDALTYPGFKVMAEGLRLELAALPAAGDGPDPDALERLCAQRHVRALYTMPTLHNPLGWVTSAARRRQLADVAERHGLLVIEDAAYAFLAEDPPPPLATLAPERTVYVCGLSKSVATGLRIGFLVVPPAWVAQVERAIRATTWSAPGVTTALACLWLDDGTVARLEAAKRADARLRQTIASEALGDLACVRHPASYFAWLPLPEEARSDQVAAALLQQGISVATAEPFATSAHVPHALRLALGSTDPGTLRQALQAVRRVVIDHAWGGPLP